MFVREIIAEQGRYAIIDRGNDIREIAVVSDLNKEKMEWSGTIAYWCYEIYGGEIVAPCTKIEALQLALDLVRYRTEEKYIPRPRLEELATMFKDGLIEDDECEAMYYFENECEMEDYEYEFFGIEKESEEE